MSRYRVIVTVSVACGAILFAVFQTQGFLDPSRDENAYTEKKAQVNVQNLDSETVKKLESTQQDKSESVEPDFDPDRNNPFAE